MRGASRFSPVTGDVRIFLVAGAMLFGALGCAPAENQVPRGASPSITPAPQAIATRLLAELRGRLVLADGCFRVETGQGSYLMGWAPLFNVRLSNDEVEITDTLTREKQTWRVGDEVHVGGAYPDQLELQFRHGQLRSCEGPYFVMHTF